MANAQQSAPSSSATYYYSPPDEISYDCPHCSFQAKSKANLQQHVNLHVVRSKVCCPLCSYSSSSSTAVGRHFKRDHSKQLEKSDKEKTVKQRKKVQENVQQEDKNEIEKPVEDGVKDPIIVQQEGKTDEVPKQVEVVKDPEIIQPPGKEADLPPMPQNPPLLNNVPLQNRIEVEVVDISEETDNEEPEPRCLCDGHGSGSRVSCDQCDEDFHCLCVGITEAMRERLERKNAEWFCPRCNHKEYPMMHKAKLMQMVQIMIQKFPPLGSVDPAVQLNDQNPPIDLSSSADVSSKQEEDICKAELARLALDIKAAKSTLEKTKQALHDEANGTRMDGSGMPGYHRKMEQLKMKNRELSAKKAALIKLREGFQQQVNELTGQKKQLKQEMGNLKEEPAFKKIKLESSSPTSSAPFTEMKEKEALFLDVKVKLDVVRKEFQGLLSRIHRVEKDIEENARNLTQMHAKLDPSNKGNHAAGSISTIAVELKALKKEQRKRIARFSSLEEKILDISCSYVRDEIRRKKQEWIVALADSDED